MEKICSYLPPLDRLLLLSLFIWDGYGKLIDIGATLQEFQAAGRPRASLSDRQLPNGPGGNGAPTQVL